MICPAGKAEVSAVYVVVNKLADNVARREKGSSLVCRPLHSIQVYAVFVHLP